MGHDTCSLDGPMNALKGVFRRVNTFVEAETAETAERTAKKGKKRKKKEEVQPVLFREVSGFKILFCMILPKKNINVV